MKAYKQNKYVLNWLLTKGSIHRIQVPYIARLAARIRDLRDRYPGIPIKADNKHYTPDSWVSLYELHEDDWKLYIESIKK